MTQERIWDYGAPRRTRLLNKRYLDILPSRCVIAGFNVTATDIPSLLLNVGAGVLVDQSGVVIRESADIPVAVTVVPDVSYPRIDYVVAEHVYDTTVYPQGYAVIKGSANVVPVPPALPENSVKLAEIWVPANAFAITQDMIYPVIKGSADNTLLSRDRISELQPISTSQTNTGISDKILVRAGSYTNSPGKAVVRIEDQLSPSFGPVTSGHERIDIVTIDDNGVVDTFPGIEADPGEAVPQDYPTDKQVVAEVFVDETDQVFISPDDITDVRFMFNLGGGGGGGGILQVRRYDAVASAGQTVVTLPWTYTPGNQQLVVTSSGVVLKVGDDYTESTGNTVTFVTGRPAGETISILRFEYIVSGTIEEAISGIVRSQLVNGGFKTWQRGSGPFVYDQSFGPDEWALSVGYSSILGVSQNTVLMKYGTSCAEVNVTMGVDPAQLQQGLETYKSLEGTTVTLSMWIKCSVYGCARIGLGDYDGTDQVVYSNYHTGSGNWERLVVTKTIRTGLVTSTSIPHGFGAWAFVDFQTSASGVLLDGSMLATGIAPDGYTYSPGNEAEEMERCQRFYETGDIYGFPAYDINAEDYYFPYNVGIYTPYKTFKQATPVITVDNWIWDGGSYPPSVSAETQKGFRLASLDGAQSTEFSCDWIAEVVF